MSSTMGEVSTVSKASSKFESLRTTIPRSIVKQWRLKEGDLLDWSWEAKDNKMILIVEKLKQW